MITAFVLKDINNYDTVAITGDFNGMMVVEPIDDLNKDNNKGLVQARGVLCEDILDDRIYGNKKNYIIREGEYCRVCRIESIE